jgi:hypothetical protein
MPPQNQTAPGLSAGQLPDQSNLIASQQQQILGMGGAFPQTSQQPPQVD